MTCQASPTDPSSRWARPQQAICALRNALPAHILLITLSFFNALPSLSLVISRAIPCPTMDLFRVSDGAYERNKLDLSQFETWDDLQRGISEILDIPVAQVIVFADDGRAVDERLFHELWERGEGVRGGLYVFDREAFGAEPEEWVRGLEEEVVLDIELPRESDVQGPVGQELMARVVRPLRSAHLANQTLAPFLANLKRIHTLEEGLNVQRAGLRIAGGNLDEHASRLVDGQPGEEDSGQEEGEAARGWLAFQRLVEAELGRERSLIGPHPAPLPITETSSTTATEWGMEQDMHVISSIEVHEVFKRSVPKAQDKPIRRVSGAAGSPTPMSAVPSGRAPSVAEKRKVLADYVSAGKMKTVHENCQKLYGASGIIHSPRYSKAEFSRRGTPKYVLRHLKRRFCAAERDRSDCAEYRGDGAAGGARGGRDGRACRGDCG